MATIQDIADEVGISKTAVSRILNGKGSFSMETIEKVKSTARRMNYLSAGMARQEEDSLKLLAAIFPTVVTPYYGILTTLMEQTMYDYGYNLMLCGSLHDYDKEEEFINNLRQRRIKGILLGSFVMDDKAFLQDELPVVTVGYHLSDQIPTVRSDNYSAGKIAAMHLIGKGCRKCLYISGMQDGLEQDERYHGFRDTLEKHGVELHAYITTMDDKLNGSIPGIITHMAIEHPEADGLFSESQRLAMESIRVYEDLGIKIPEQMKIIGYGNPYLLPYSNPRLTLVKENTKEIAKKAVELLIERIEHPEKEIKSIIVPVSLEQNQTT